MRLYLPLAQRCRCCGIPTATFLFAIYRLESVDRFAYLDVLFISHKYHIFTVNLPFPLFAEAHLILPALSAYIIHGIVLKRRSIVVSLHRIYSGKGRRRVWIRSEWEKLQFQGPN